MEWHTYVHKHMFTDWFARVQVTKLGLSASMASARPPRLGAAGAFGLQARWHPAKPRGLGIAATLSRPLAGVFGGTHRVFEGTHR